MTKRLPMEVQMALEKADSESRLMDYAREEILRLSICISDEKGLRERAEAELARLKKPITLIWPCAQHQGMPFTMKATATALGAPGTRQVCPHCHPEEVL